MGSIKHEVSVSSLTHEQLVVLVQCYNSLTVFNVRILIYIIFLTRTL